ncbi:Thioesterase/thiol ester dehydrase-isomerase [Serendipita vermifera]|nr:Thioesterase/thiol ester dehydrase-isomerase [Serendipita vermifera]
MEAASETSTREFLGTATQEQKDTIVYWFKNFTGEYNRNIVRRLTPTKFDVVLDDGNGQRASGTLVVELTIEEDMCNGYRSLHGGCAAFLVDKYDSVSSVMLSAFSSHHVSLNLNVDYHAPIPVGSVVEIVASTKAIGKRVMFTKCEIYHKGKNVPLITGTHTKMTPSFIAKL